MPSPYGYHWRHHVRPAAFVCAGVNPRTGIGKCPACGNVRKLDVCHKDGVAGRDEPDNLMVRCRPCHNRYDARKRNQDAKRTRQTKKDQARPLLLAEALAWGERFESLGRSD
jgi:hypothetical protein